MRSGKMAVSYFFVLSGFVLCNRYKNEMTAATVFYRRRLARIYPLYLLAFALSVLVFPVTAGGNIAAPLLLSAGLVQAWFPQYAVAINAPAWSLSVEMLFYALFPLLIRQYANRTRAFLLTTLILYCATQCIFFALQSQIAIYDISKTIFLHPALHVCEFAVGMAGVYFADRYARYITPRVVVLFFCATLLGLFLARAGAANNTSILAPVFMAFIVAIAVRPPRLLLYKPLLYLGEISYSIYLLHAPLYALLQQVNTKVTHLNQQAFFYLFIALLLFISALSYRFAELPLQRWINGASRSRQ